MPFHVEVRSPPQHARVFNIGHADLQQILKPWIAGHTFELGEQEWEPRESTLTILEGPVLAGPDLAYGQGWSNALRTAEDVTRRLIDVAETETPLAPVFMVEADSVDTAAAQMTSDSTPTPIEWAEARQRVDGRDPKVAAVILVVKSP